MTTWAALDGQRFISLETFRKSGEGVRTPVSFVIDGDALYVRTQADSGKVLGDWIDATATIVDAAENARVRTLVLARYGLIWRTLEFVNSVRGLFGGGGEWVTIRVTK
jgi:uncharacterized protein